MKTHASRRAARRGGRQPAAPLSPADAPVPPPRLPAAADSARPPRQPWPDRVRGVAVLLMVAYHLSFDLDHYGLIRQAFNTDWRWLSLRAVIVSLFMGALGASAWLAHPAAIRWQALWRRQLRLGAACLAVSAGSALMFPASWIWFGTLHFAWLATWLALPLRRIAGHWGLLVAAVLLAGAGNGPGLAAFDAPALRWVGLMTHKPFTEDYVPLLPWFAAVLVGLWIMPLVVDRQDAGAAVHLREEVRPGGLATRRAEAWLRWLGRHSLLIYLLHQPLLIGLFELRAALQAS